MDKIKVSLISEKVFEKSFPKLYNVVKENCLFNITEETTLEEFGNFPQVIQKQKFMQNIFANDEEIFKNDWLKKIVEPLEKLLNRKIYCTVGGNHFSFTAFCWLDEFNTESTRFSLNFNISFMNNLFSLEINEEKKVKDPDYEFFKNKIKDYEEYYFKSNKVYVSPVKPFQKIFLEVENFIRKIFPEHKFLPSYFDLIKVQGLCANNDLRPNTTISICLLQKEGILESKFSENLLSVVGDIYYGDFPIIAQ